MYVNTYRQQKIPIVENNVFSLIAENGVFSLVDDHKGFASSLCGMVVPVPSYKYLIWRAQSILDHTGPVCVPENRKISESFDMYGISDPVLCPLVICLESSIALYNLGG